MFFNIEVLSVQPVSTTFNIQFLHKWYAVFSNFVCSNVTSLNEF